MGRWLGLGAAAAIAASVVASAGASGASSGGTVTTVAGNAGNRDGFSGDDGPARKAQFGTRLWALAVDGKGSLYIADNDNNRIRKVTLGGTITTFAGGGTPGAGGAIGDGGPATRAVLSLPRGVAADGAGNVYIADSSHFRIRKVTPDGTITTIAGTGQPGTAGDGGPATGALLFNPAALAVDRKGNVYIPSGTEVRRISPDGTIKRYAGGAPGSSLGDGGPAVKAHLGTPEGLAVDAKGNLYIADNFYQRVRKVDPAGRITTFAGGGPLTGPNGDGGPATKARVSPIGVGDDGQGNLYITEVGDVRKVDRGGTITTYAGCFGVRCHIEDGRPAKETILSGDGAIAVDRQGNVYLDRYRSDISSASVRKIAKGIAAAPVTKKAPHGKHATKPSSTTAIKAAASKIEIDLAQLASGREKLKAALTNAANCSISPAAAAVQVAGVIANRQKVLAGLSGLVVSTAQAARIRSLLRSELTYSIAADRYYQSWLSHLTPTAGCSLAHDQNYQAAQRQDVLATAAKQRFVAAFNPFARSLHLRTWAAAEF